MDQLSRFELLIGEKIEKIKNLTVLVVGLGGVGSYATEALCRSGVGRLILIDHDTIDITNLNRQLMALHSNIGRSKVEVWKERIKDINPECEVIGMREFLTSETAEDLLFPYGIDYIVDACDTVDAKLALIEYAQTHHIKLISCMGTGNKLNATKVEIMELKRTQNDPLARVMRKKIRDRGLSDDVIVVCSKELPCPNESKVIGSTAFVPSVAGLYCASYVVNDRLSCEENI